MRAETLFLLVLLGHVALVMGLYVWLTVLRQRAVQRGQAKIGDFARADGDPVASKRVQRNLANQFELPLFTYFSACLLVTWQAVGWIDVVAACIFTVGRAIHTAVQTLSDNVVLRGQVFVINCIGVVMLLGHVAWIVLQRLTS